MIDTKRLTVDAGAAAPLEGSDDLVLAVGSCPVLRLTMVESAESGAAACSYSAGDYYAAFVGTAYGTTAEPLVEVLSGFNSADDWAEADAVAGKVSVRLPLDGGDLADAMADGEELNCRLQVWRYRDIDDKPCLMLDTPVLVVPTGGEAP